jgi:cysteine-rich repeat protein
VTEVNYVVVLVNSTKLAERTGVSYHTDEFEQYSIVIIILIRVRFADMDSNFDIPSTFSSSDGYRERCIIGIYSNRISSNTAFTSFIDINTVGLNYVESIPPSFSTRYSVLCYYKLYYKGECADLFAFSTCAVCNKSACITCPPGTTLTAPGVCTCSTDPQVNNSCVPEGCITYVPVYGTVTCTACNATLYDPAPVSNACHCILVVGGVCTMMLEGAACTAIGFSCCDNCTLLACLSCNSGMVLTAGYCECVGGLSNVNGSCVPEGCTTYAPVPGTVTCTACNATLYDPTPVGNVCPCIFLQGGVCTLLLYGPNCTAIGFTCCENCTEMACLTCTPGMVLTVGHCDCPADLNNVNGSCVPEGCISYNATIGIVSCQECSHAMYHATPVLNECQCIYMVAGVCVVVYEGPDCDPFGFIYCGQCTDTICISCPPGMILSSPIQCDCPPDTDSLNGSCIPEGCDSYAPTLGVVHCLGCNDSLYAPIPFANECLCLYVIGGVCTLVLEGVDCEALGFAYCLKCTETYCMNCPPGMALNGSDCECTSGVPINGSCVPVGCDSYTPVVGLVSCLGCEESMYAATPVSNECQCLFIINGVCTLVLNGPDCEAIGFTYCARCTETYCMYCQPDFYLNNGVCECIIGENINGVCNRIPGCIQPYNLNAAVQVCQACNETDFFGRPVNGACQCYVGTLVSGVCNTIWGCIVPQVYPNGSIWCAFCNTTAGFLSFPVGGGVNCECSPAYYLDIDHCVEVCGDGFLYSETPGDCDDGNNLDGDGCSSTCRVEDYYSCSNQIPETPSVCVYKGIPTNLTLDYIERNVEANQGTFYFKLTPTLTILNKMDFSNRTTLSCNSEY